MLEGVGSAEEYVPGTLHETLGSISRELFSKYCTFSITEGICSMLAGRAENLLYNLQASTYTENENHLNSDHNHIVLIREDKMFKSLLLITFRGKIEKMWLLFIFFEVISKKTFKSQSNSFLRMILESTHYFPFSD